MILCPYHGPRLPSVGDESLCSACASVGRSVPALDHFVPLAPLIATARYPAASGELSEPVFSVVPGQHLLATPPTALLTVDDVVPHIASHIGDLERLLDASALAAIGPLVLLYDHPDVRDFEHFYFAAAYPVNAGAPCPPTLRESYIPSHGVASIQFTGPWSMLHVAYPPLRRFIHAAGRSFGPLSLERYLVPRGTNDPGNVTIIQRQLAEA
jgi:effector-binding domain-containing protein